MSARAVRDASRRSPRWFAPAVIWLVSVPVFSLNWHLCVLLLDPAVTRHSQYGFLLFTGMGFGWILGWIPAGYAWALLGRSRNGGTRLALYAIAYWAALVLVNSLVELLRTGSVLTLLWLPAMIAAVPHSLRALPMAVFYPVGLGLAATGLVPVLGLLAWYGASVRKRR